jgi:D-amino peptidase
MKYYISFDFEGLAGITNWPETLGRTRCEELATEQLNAFLAGIYESEPEAEVVVGDSHALGNNLHWDKLIGKTKLVKGYPRRFYMIEGLDSSFAGLILFGYHAPAGFKGNMDHTYSSSSIYNLEINGRTVSEAEINTLIASYYKVPLKFVYCDDGAAEWLYNSISPELNVLVSKKAISRFAAEISSQQQILSELKQAGLQLPTNKGFILPPEKKYVCRIQMMDSCIGYACSIIPGVREIDARTIEFTAPDVLLFYRYLMTVTMVAGSVKDLYK